MENIEKIEIINSLLTTVFLGIINTLVKLTPSRTLTMATTGKNAQNGKIAQNKTKKGQDANDATAQDTPQTDAPKTKEQEVLEALLEELTVVLDQNAESLPDLNAPLDDQNPWNLALAIALAAKNYVLRALNGDKIAAAHVTFLRNATVKAKDGTDLRVNLIRAALTMLMNYDVRMLGDYDRRTDSRRAYRPDAAEVLALFGAYTPRGAAGPAAGQASADEASADESDASGDADEANADEDTAPKAKKGGKKGGKPKEKPYYDPRFFLTGDERAMSANDAISHKDDDGKVRNDLRALAKAFVIQCAKWVASYFPRGDRMLPMRASAPAAKIQRGRPVKEEKTCITPSEATGARGLASDGLTALIAEFMPIYNAYVFSAGIGTAFPPFYSKIKELATELKAEREANGTAATKSGPKSKGQNNRVVVRPKFDDDADQSGQSKSAQSKSAQFNKGKPNKGKGPAPAADDDDDRPRRPAPKPAPKAKKLYKITRDGVTRTFHWDNRTKKEKGVKVVDAEGFEAKGERVTIEDWRIYLDEHGNPTGEEELVRTKWVSGVPLDVQDSPAAADAVEPVTEVELQSGAQPETQPTETAETEAQPEAQPTSPDVPVRKTWASVASAAPAASATAPAAEADA